jgi:CheY-like chemotaxis protein
MACHILLVDDSGFARRSLRQILQGAGHSVDEAKDGMEALERDTERKPDVVLFDMVMDGMQRARELGAAEYIVKPITIPKLRELLSQPA